MGIIFNNNRMSMLQEQLNSPWTVEEDDVTTLTSRVRDCWRIVTIWDRERWNKLGTSARVPFIASVCSKELALSIVRQHNESLGFK